MISSALVSKLAKKGMGNKKVSRMMVAVAAAIIGLAAAGQYVRGLDGWFCEQNLPLQPARDVRLFDIGVADVNQDNILDIYTSAHDYLQVIMRGDGRGGYENIPLSRLGLDQNPDFSGLETLPWDPVFDKPGLYIYWNAQGLNARAHRIGEAAGKDRRVSGRFRVFAKLALKHAESFRVDLHETSLPNEVIESNLEFSANRDGVLSLAPHPIDGPIWVDLDEQWPLDRVFVGAEKVSPGRRRLDLSTQDRHGLAWADYNGDGLTDVYISRGGLDGMLPIMPQEVRDKVHDEFFVKRENGTFEERSDPLGFEKRGCSSRHVRAVDFDGDGRLDIFNVCQDRGKAGAELFPKQLYRQEADGRFADVASEAGLAIPQAVLRSVGWLDADNDADMDMLAVQDDGYWLYANDSGKFAPHPIASVSMGGRKALGQSTDDGLRFDGKQTIADFDRDGDLDAFVASKDGNALLVNQAGTFVAASPSTAGLPDRSVSADWIDYDNDGLSDLFAVPQGLFRQQPDHRFKNTGLMELSTGEVYAAFSNWFDMDGNGSRDVLLALKARPEPIRRLGNGLDRLLNPFIRRLYRRTGKPEWQFIAYRNIGAANHWLQVDLVGTKGNRQAIGAKVAVVTPEGRQFQQVGHSDGAFYSQGHYRLYFGLGKAHRPDRIEIVWPDGQPQTIERPDSDRLLIVRQEK
jgi:hypothetical protein